MGFISFFHFLTLNRANKASKAQGPFFTRYYKPSAATVNADLLSRCAESYPLLVRCYFRVQCGILILFTLYIIHTAFTTQGLSQNKQNHFEMIPIRACGGI